MGRWFPNRKGNREQVKAFDKAQRDLNDYGREQRKAGNRNETPRYRDLNRRASEAARQVSPLQRTPLAHDVRETRTQLREQRAQRQQRRTQRGRGSR